ncbi:MAG: TolC family protein [Myxococcota bacterium]|nr:TolC family protein [Myxococcota bacterium]
MSPAVQGCGGCAALALALAWTLSPGPVRAQSHGTTPSTDVDLEDVVRLAREASPRARALRAEARVAEADVDVAGVYPNPSVSYVFMGRFDGGPEAINGSQHQAWFDVPLLIAGQHDARRDAAAAVASAVRAELDAELLALEIQARRAFLALLASQERASLLEAAREELAALRAIVEGRSDAGAQSPYDAARIAIELARTDATLAGARADVRAASALLASLLGRTSWSPRAQGHLRPGAALVVSDERVHPIIEAVRRRVIAAERDVRRAEIERWPEVSLGAGAYFTTDGDSVSAYLGLAVPLPIFDTGEAAVRRARAARDAAVDVRDAVEHELDARLEGARDVLRTRRAALDAFTSETGARVPELRDMAESSYRLGASGVFELLDAFRARVELELSRIDLSRAALDAELDLLAIAGAR